MRFPAICRVSLNSIDPRGSFLYKPPAFLLWFVTAFPSCWPGRKSDLSSFTYKVALRGVRNATRPPGIEFVWSGPKNQPLRSHARHALCVSASIASARAWATANRRSALLLGVAGLVTLACSIASVWVIVAFWGGDEVKVTPAAALAMLDAGLYPDAIEACKRLREDSSLTYDEVGLVSYILGVASALDADERWEKDKTRSYLLAAKLLEETHDRGFRPDRAAEGMYQLARCQFLGGQFAASRPNLLTALKLNPQRASELYRMLATAALNEGNPKLDLALEYNAQFLAEPSISNAARDSACIERAQILFRQGKMADCQQTLTHISENSKLRGEVIVLEGRMMMSEAEQLARRLPPSAEKETREKINGLYEQAIAIFRGAQSRDSLKAQASPKAMYLIGECWRRLDRLPEALAQLERARQLYNDFPESLVAGLSAADTLLEMGQEKEAVAAYRRELARAGQPENFSNPWSRSTPFAIAC